MFYCTILVAFWRINTCTITQYLIYNFLSILGESPLWLVPVSISTASSPTTAVNRFVLKDKQTTVTLENVKPDEWVKVSKNRGENLLCTHDHSEKKSLSLETSLYEWALRLFGSFGLSTKEPYTIMLCSLCRRHHWHHCC